MTIKYFLDTDTALFEFSNIDVQETKEINQNIYIDLDENGNLVNMTIEHAKQSASLPEFSYKEIDETEYLTKSPANKLHLETAIKNIENHINGIEVSLESIKS